MIRLALLAVLCTASLAPAADYGLFLNGHWTQPTAQGGGYAFAMPGQTLVGFWQFGRSGFDFRINGETVAHSENGLCVDPRSGLAIVPPAPLSGTLAQGGGGVLGTSPFTVPLIPLGCPNGQCPNANRVAPRPPWLP